MSNKLSEKELAEHVRIDGILQDIAIDLGNEIDGYSGDNVLYIKHETDGNRSIRFNLFQRGCCGGADERIAHLDASFAELSTNLPHKTLYDKYCQEKKDRENAIKAAKRDAELNAERIEYERLRKKFER